MNSSADVSRFDTGIILVIFVPRNLVFHSLHVTLGAVRPYQIRALVGLRVCLRVLSSPFQNSSGADRLKIRASMNQSNMDVSGYEISVGFFWGLSICLFLLRTLFVLRESEKRTSLALQMHNTSFVFYLLGHYS